jgi:hypothetical protein
VKSDGATAVNLAPIELWHRAYHHGQNSTLEQATTGTLQPGRTVRVHSGSGPDSVIRDEDLRGADHDVFTQKDYIWNNDEGDTPALYNRTTQATIDSASYDLHPPQGEVLVRSGN